MTAALGQSHCILDMVFFHLVSLGRRTVSYHVGHQDGLQLGGAEVAKDVGGKQRGHLDRTKQHNRKSAQDKHWLKVQIYD